jgi:hypothetical protein
MARDYFLLIAWGFFGILQIAASYSGLYGLRLFSVRWQGYLFGLVFAAAAFVWFYASGNRTIEGHITGVQGAEQFELILAGVASSVFVTAALVSLLRLKSRAPAGKPGISLEQLRSQTYLQAALRRWRVQD